MFQSNWFSTTLLLYKLTYILNAKISERLSRRLFTRLFILTIALGKPLHILIGITIQTDLSVLLCAYYLPDPRWPTPLLCRNWLPRRFLIFIRRTTLYLLIALSIALITLISTNFQRKLIEFYYTYCPFSTIYALLAMNFRTFAISLLTPIPYAFITLSNFFLPSLTTSITFADLFHLSLHFTSKLQQNATKADDKTTDHF